MKKTKIYCYRTVQAKGQYWSSFCANKISDHKDLHKVWRKLIEMKKGVNLPNCPVRLENAKFATTFEKAEAFTEMFAQTSRRGLSQKCKHYRENEDLNNIFKEPAQSNEHYVF